MMSEIPFVDIARTGIEEVKKIEIDVKRIAVWTLIITNAFFISYFFAKLFHMV
jgi:hypothetical protein